MVSNEVEIINRLGLHARAAAKFVNIASGFHSHVELENNGRSVNGKSIMGVMMLAAAKGSSLTITAQGVDQTAALDAISELIEHRFGEAE